jgi:succinate dehydrogenase / fumarate reductase cytochrome b subunit
MNTLVNFYRSSVGKKLIVGLTVLLLASYLVIHLIGNLLLFRSDNGAWFNAYADNLPNILVIRIIEILLFAIFLVHILTGVIVWFINRRSRGPDRYAVYHPQENSALSSRTMLFSGSIVFIFLVIHMRNFWYTSRYQADAGFSMYALVRSTFADPVYSGLYLVALFLLGFHLRHGFQSAFQTFGLRNKRYAPLIEWVGVIFWLVIPFLFATMPLYFYFYS